MDKKKKISKKYASLKVDPKVWEVAQKTIESIGVRNATATQVIDLLLSIAETTKKRKGN